MVGVEFLIKNSVKTCAIKPRVSSDTEIWIKMLLKRKKSLHIGVCYEKHESRNTINILDGESQYTEKPRNSFIGDFNAKIPKDEQSIIDGDQKVTSNGSTL